MNRKDVFIHISIESLVKLVIFAVALFLFYELREVLLLVFAAVVIAAAIQPAVRFLRKLHIPRVISVIIIYFMLALGILAVFYFLLLPLLNQTSLFVKSLPTYIQSIDSTGFGSDSFLGSQPIFQQLSQSISFTGIVTHVNAALSQFSEGILNTIAVAFGGLFSFVLVIVLSFYLAVQEDGVLHFLRIITPFQHRDYVIDLWKRVERKIGLWMQGQLLLAVIVALLTYAALAAIGLPYALLLAVFAGLFELIPLFGPIIASIPAIVVAFPNGGLPLTLLIVGVYIIIQQLENHIIYPLVVRKVVGVPAIIVILSLVIGGSLAGFLGVVLAVPVATILMEFFHDIQHKQLQDDKKRSEDFSRL